MKKYGVVIFTFLVVVMILSGCSDSTNKFDQMDSRLFGDWENTLSGDMLTFYEDGMYQAEEGEYANWSVDGRGNIMMYGVLFTYELTENDSLLNLTSDSFTRTFRKL